MRKLLILFLLSILAQYLRAQQLAFPSAEGFGQYASGGRGGTVYHVTNLNDAGVGSFRDAVSQPNRTVVFDVGGIIRITSTVRVSSNITIAGQTAPGDGICIYGAGVAFGGSQNIIARYIRIRAGIIAPSGTDATGISQGKRMIFDHLSVSWGRDGTFDMNKVAGRILDSITLQNMIISHGLVPHSTGGLMNTDGNISVLRSLYINNWTRNPKVTCNNQFVNNVIYNWGASSYNFGGANYTTYSNVTNNYMISGQGGTRPGIMGGDPFVNAYLKGNFWDSNRNGKLDGTEYTAYSDSIVRATSPYSFPIIKNEMTAVQSYYNVIANVGASLHRDQVDSLLMIDLKSLGTKGIFISSEDTLETKGPGVIKGGTTPTDTDQDGMPDAWEKQFGFNYLLPDNNGDADKDGYTNLEEYLNCLVGEGNCTPPTCYAIIYESQSDTLCEGNSKTLTANAGASYKWYKGTTLVGTSASYNVTSSGVYNVEVTNSNNCKATSPTVTITVVPLPVATITPQSSTTFCEGGNVVLSASTASSYKWLKGTTVVANTKTYTATTSGSYTVELENLGCKKTSLPTIVTVNALPQATVMMAGDLNLCAGETVTFTANAATSYKWFNGTTQVGTLQSLRTGNAGSYTVEVTNAAGCKKTSSAYVVKVNPLPVITQNVKVNNGSWRGTDSVSVCKGATIEMGPWPNVAIGWSWTGPNRYTSSLRNPILSNVSVSGAYYATYTDPNGCKATSPVKVNINSPIVTITSPANNATSTTDIFSINASVTGTNISNVSFYNGSSLLGTDVISPYSFTTLSLANGTYTFYAIAKNTSNCTDTAKVTVKVNKVVTDLEENSLGENLSISPNPFEDQLVIQFQNQTFEYSIYDIDGKLHEQGLGIEKLNTGNKLSPGLYILKINVGDNVYISKIYKY